MIEEYKILNRENEYFVEFKKVTEIKMKKTIKLEK